MVRKESPQGVPPLKMRIENGIKQLKFEKADKFTKTEHNQTPLIDRSVTFKVDVVFNFKDGVTKLIKAYQKLFPLL